MVNNSVYILINETLYKSIDSEIFPNLDNIQKYNIIPYLISETNKIIYIITFISNNTSINFYLYELIFSNILQSNILKSNLIKTHIINDTDLSNDISCQLINYDSCLKCFYHKTNILLKIFIASFKIEGNYKYKNETSNENFFSVQGAQDNVIKTSLINNNHIFIIIISKSFIKYAIYNYNEKKIIYKEKLNITKIEEKKIKRNEYEIYYLDNQIISLFKNDTYIRTSLIRNISNNNTYEYNIQNIAKNNSCQDVFYFILYNQSNSNNYELKYYF